MSTAGGIKKSIKGFLVNTGKRIVEIWNGFTKLSTVKKILICAGTTAAVTLIVLGVICAVWTSKLTGYADEYLAELERGNLNKIAMMTNYPYDATIADDMDDTDDTAVSQSDASIIPLIMKNSDFSRSSIFTLNRSAGFELSVNVPDMYKTLMELAGFEYVNTMTESDIENLLTGAAESSDTKRIKITVNVKVEEVGGVPVYYVDEKEFMDAVSGNLTRGYRELYAQAMEEMTAYIGGNVQ